MVQQVCRQTGAEFMISDEDLAFYERVSPLFNGKKYLIPPPKLAPDVRFMHRLAWRNERGLYKRKCDKTGESIVSWISPDKPYKVYKKDVWWGDSWDALSFGRDFDFSRTFFDQFADLMKEVPWLDLLVDKTLNSDYANFCNNIKNCYLVYASNNNQDCMFCSYVWGSKDCLDCLQAFDCELCYECVDVVKCYQAFYSLGCENCRDIWFCENCRNCQDCAFSVNLVGKKYCFMNQQLSKEDYEKRLALVRLGEFSKLVEARKFFAGQRLKFPKRFAQILNCENSSGDNIKNSKNLKYGFDTSGAEDCKWMWLGSDPVKDCYDLSGVEGVELSYNSVVVGLPASRICFSSYVWSNVSEILYSVLSPGSKNCFGVCGLHKGEYCILNKKYTREEYENLVPRIIEHMQKTGEWGEFFPPKLSPFGYNETLANDYFPMPKEEVLQHGFNWSDYENPPLSFDKILKSAELPESIENVDDGIVNSVIECDVLKKYFKILPQELKFYKKHKLPLPRKHPDVRHMERMALRNPRRLWQRNCAKCNLPIESSFSPDRPESVYCDKCFLAEVY